jgi:hypothetical protein
LERASFITTIIAGFMTCILFAWQGMSGMNADWVPGFLCVCWSLLMLMRLMMLTAPAQGDTGQKHLAYRILYAMDKNAERKRQSVLDQSFGTPFAAFLLLGIFFAAWQLFCTLYATGHYQVLGFSGAVENFFAAYDRTPALTSSLIFEWGQGFFYILCVAMMGFVLRSYAGLIEENRITLLILSSYMVGGVITFFGLGGGMVNTDLQAGLIGFGPAGDMFDRSVLLFDRLVLHNGILGLAFMACILFVPLAFIWISKPDRTGRDYLVSICGTLAALSLFLSVFFPLHPALDGFLFLCWMGLFLAWGGAERRMIMASA